MKRLRENLTVGQGIMGKILGVLIILVFLLVIPYFFESQKPNITQKEIEKTKLLFVGDIMLSRQIGTIIRREQDPHYHFLRIADKTNSADIAFANLESVASTRGKNVGSIYSFRAEPDTLKGLSFAGFDVVSVANNHAFDWGPDAFLDTQMLLDNLAIKHIGGGNDSASARTPVIFKKNNTTFAYLGYSEFANPRPPKGYPVVAPLVLEEMIKDITLAKQSADVVIVSVHWGTEYETKASDEQRRVARELIDAGALIVAGHHPHVMQEVERYNSGLIAYSLGNFIFDQNFSADTQKGMMLGITMKGNGIESYTTDIVRFTKTYQPYLDEFQ